METEQTLRGTRQDVRFFSWRAEIAELRRALREANGRAETLAKRVQVLEARVEELERDEIGPGIPLPPTIATDEEVDLEALREEALEAANWDEDFEEDEIGEDGEQTIWDLYKDLR